MNTEICPIKVRKEADPDCQANCPFQIDRKMTSARLHLIWMALLHDRKQATDYDRAILNTRIEALETIIESQETVAESAATTCRLPERRRRILGVVGKEATRCSSQVSQNYDRAVSKIDYAPVSEALSLIASRPVAREFLVEAAASSGIEMPTLRIEDPAT